MKSQNFFSKKLHQHLIMIDPNLPFTCLHKMQVIHHFNISTFFLNLYSVIVTVTWCYVEVALSASLY